MIEIHDDGWLFRVVDPAFELVIPHWEGMDPATASEADATIRLPDGTRRYATFMTLDGIAKIMSRWQATGECLNGRYFYCTDLVIIDNVGFHAMADIVRDLIDTGDIEHACGLLSSED